MSTLLYVDECRKIIRKKTSHSCNSFFFFSSLLFLPLSPSSFQTSYVNNQVSDFSFLSALVYTRKSLEKRKKNWTSLHCYVSIYICLLFYSAFRSNIFLRYLSLTRQNILYFPMIFIDNVLP